jgi:hypothetical protein
MTDHDFSPIALRCVECGLPTTQRAMECRPSNGDMPADIEALRMAETTGEWE